MYTIKHYIALSLLAFLCNKHVYAAETVNPIKSESSAMHAVIEIKTTDELDKYKKGGKPTVVKFYASWCGPCKESKGVYESLSKDFADINFIAVDGDAAPSMVNDFNIQNYPTLLFFDKNGTLLFSHPGAPTKGALMDFLEKLKNGTLQKQAVKSKVVSDKPKMAPAPMETKKEKPAQKRQSKRKPAPQKKSAPQEIVRKGPGGKRIRYVAVED